MVLSQGSGAVCHSPTRLRTAHPFPRLSPFVRLSSFPEGLDAGWPTPILMRVGVGTRYTGSILDDLLIDKPAFAFPTHTSYGKKKRRCI